MFKNIGRKIKGLASFLFWITVIFAVIGGLLALVTLTRLTDNGAVLGLVIAIVIIVVGIIFAWLSNFMLYGFGELIDTNQKMLRIMESQNTPAPMPAPTPAPTPTPDDIGLN